MPAYIITLIDIKDPVQYEDYGKAFQFESFAEDYGGEFLIVSDEAEVLEGEWNCRTVLTKFPNAENAPNWYDSSQYRDVRKIRQASATTDMILQPGFDVNAALAERSSER